MKRRITIGIVIFSVVILTSCSVNVNFVIINESESPIEIEYFVKDEFRSLEETGLQPFRMKLTDWDPIFGSHEDSWNKLSQSEYSYNNSSHICKVKVAPNEVLRLIRETNAGGNSDFPIMSIKISGRNGIVTYEGNQIFKQFLQADYSNRYIYYK